MGRPKFFFFPASLSLPLSDASNRRQDRIICTSSLCAQYHFIRKTKRAIQGGRREWDASKRGYCCSLLAGY
ncbi:hypothetical protein F5Y14DRAFT_434324 [Nemania sp. NC0429]|nr:hypothetical protein F5Y14DRAFT_434324 [Nemania sp. NC0429]